MQHLPDAILFQLCSFLDVPDIAALSVTCRRLKTFTEQAEAWLGRSPDGKRWVAGDPKIAESFQRLKQQRHLQSLVETGKWRDSLYLAARDTGSNQAPQKVEFSSFLNVDDATAQAGHTLITDGQLVAIFNAEGVLIKGLLPPAIRHDSLIRPRAPIFPVYGRPTSQLSRIVLQTLIQPQGGLQEWPIVCSSMYKPRLPSGSALAVPTHVPTDHPLHPSDLAALLLSRSIPLRHIEYLDVSNHALRDDAIKDLLFQCPHLKTLIASGTGVGGLSLMVLGAYIPGTTSAGTTPRPRMGSSAGSAGPSNTSSPGTSSPVSHASLQLGTARSGSGELEGEGVVGQVGVEGRSGSLSASPPALMHLHHQLTYLDLSGCPSLSTGAGRLGSLVRAAIGRLPSLKALNLSRTAMGLSLSPPFESALSSCLLRLTELKLENTEGLTPEAMAALLCSCTNLRTLSAQSTALAKGNGRAPDAIFAALQQMPGPSHGRPSPPRKTQPSTSNRSRSSSPPSPDAHETREAKKALATSAQTPAQPQGGPNSCNCGSHNHTLTQNSSLQDESLDVSATERKEKESCINTPEGLIPTENVVRESASAVAASHGSDSSTPESGLSLPKLDCRLPSLHALSVGWGFGLSSLRALSGSSPFLQEFSAGIGAGVTDTLLTSLAVGCPHLKRLGLLMSPVSDAGVNAVLLGCPKLESLRLVHCVGPFTDAMAQGLSSKHRVGFTELQLLSPHVTISNASLATIIGSSRPSLKILALTGCRCLSNSFISLLHCHAPVLEHLRLEDCFYTPAPPTPRTTHRTSFDGSATPPHPHPSPRLRTRRIRIPTSLPSISLSLSDTSPSSSLSLKLPGSSASTPTPTRHAMNAFANGTTPFGSLLDTSSTTSTFLAASSPSSSGTTPHAPAATGSTISPTLPGQTLAPEREAPEREREQSTPAPEQVSTPHSISTNTALLSSPASSLSGISTGIDSPSTNGTLSSVPQGTTNSASVPAGVPLEGNSEVLIGKQTAVETGGAGSDDVKTIERLSVGALGQVTAGEFEMMRQMNELSIGGNGSVTAADSKTIRTTEDLSFGTLSETTDDGSDMMSRMEQLSDGALGSSKAGYSDVMSKIGLSDGALGNLKADDSDVVRERLEQSVGVSGELQASDVDMLVDRTSQSINDDVLLNGAGQRVSGPILTVENVHHTVLNTESVIDSNVVGVGRKGGSSFVALGGTASGGSTFTSTCGSNCGGACASHGATLGGTASRGTTATSGCTGTGTGATHGTTLSGTASCGTTATNTCDNTCALHGTTSGGASCGTTATTICGSTCAHGATLGQTACSTAAPSSTATSMTVVGSTGSGDAGLRCTAGGDAALCCTASNHDTSCEPQSASIAVHRTAADTTTLHSISTAHGTSTIHGTCTGSDVITCIEARITLSYTASGADAGAQPNKTAATIENNVTSSSCASGITSETGADCSGLGNGRYSNVADGVTPASSLAPSIHCTGSGTGTCSRDSDSVSPASPSVPAVDRPALGMGNCSSDVDVATRASTSVPATDQTGSGTHTCSRDSESVSRASIAGPRTDGNGLGNDSTQNVGLGANRGFVPGVKAARTDTGCLMKAFDGKELLHLLLQCAELRSLQLRHCCVINSTFLQRVCTACPLLQELVVDQCDLEQWPPTIGGDCYWALQHVKVFNCRSIDPNPADANDKSKKTAEDMRIHRRVTNGNVLLVNRADGRVFSAHDVLH